MVNIFLIGMGGFSGAILRYWISSFVASVFTFGHLPYGTLAVNILGSLMIGFFGGIAETLGIFTPETRSFFFVGFLGALTTFSTFSMETFTLMHEGSPFLAMFNAAANLVLCLAAVWLGRSTLQLLVP